MWYCPPEDRKSSLLYDVFAAAEEHGDRTFFYIVQFHLVVTAKVLVFAWLSPLACQSEI